MNQYLNMAPRMEFHVSRQSRDKYRFDESLFGLTGNVVFANFQAARVFAQRMNEGRDLARHPDQAVRAGQINAMGLIDEILHFMVALYREQRNPQAMAEALEWLNERLGKAAVDVTLRRFVEEFPPLAVHRGTLSPSAYLEGNTSSVPNRQIVLEEMLMLWLANLNPAFAPFGELFDDLNLTRETIYEPIMSDLHRFFETQPRFGPDNQNLIDMLRAPALNAPDSLAGQLAYIRSRWGVLLGRYLLRLLSSMDFIQEEEKPVFTGPGPAVVYEYLAEEYHEPEQFSPDRDWMPRLVLIAKNTYVWLDQLSKKYGYTISRLDQIPDEELDLLAHQGFTGLWFIGLWERSPASRRIKQLCGKPDAGASAYSLYDYQIAEELGGEAALQNLKDRAWRRGIRLASDMVPNHVGIYSRWVVEHPDWFISLDYSPFPSYSFNGPNLSEDGRVGIYLEDHYYNATDAAVVFKRVDHWTGDVKYIYHGNDGTSMPWNDTAQLNYLLPEVREAVIQTILHVARQFPIIRFDAAMTLTKRHYQRLWFPEPGTGGAIPTRAEFGLTRAQFDAAMPNEFWREVVDRAAVEAPDTLLLAEAFWLMEGYFVRTLGMHRVYNSAFMNMLRDEKNAEYRLVIKNTLEFDPEILKRYVNFMNNPDERTAAEQFGKGDKYFGICTMMATLPGLPMFGHGQIEGYTEKYGMEFHRAMWNEKPDPYLMERHEREIFPLLHRRRLFAEVEHFLLYDFYASDGYVNEDVFAYSNRSGDDRALIVYHNRYAEARGWVRMSAAFSAKVNDNGERQLTQRSLAQGLGLHDGDNWYTIFRDHVAGLEYIRSNRELSDRGLYVELGAYQYHVFLDFRQVESDAQHPYAALAAALNGRGVPGIDEALQEMVLEPILTPYRALIDVELFARLMAAQASSLDDATASALLDEVEHRAARVSSAIRDYVLASQAATGQNRTAAGPTPNHVADVAQEIRRKVAAVLRLPLLGQYVPPNRSPQYAQAIVYIQSRLAEGPATWGTLLGWALTADLGKVTISAEGEATAASPAQRIRAWLDEWLLGKSLVATLRSLGLDEWAASQSLNVIRILILHSKWAADLSSQKAPLSPVLDRWLQDPAVRQFIGVNLFNDVLWFNKEGFETLLWWLMVAAAIEAGVAPGLTSDQVVRRTARAYVAVKRLLNAATEAQYQLDRLPQKV